MGSGLRTFIEGRVFKALVNLVNSIGRSIQQFAQDVYDKCVEIYNALRNLAQWRRYLQLLNRLKDKIATCATSAALNFQSLLTKLTV